MYLEHFGLRELPFSLTPDTSYYFELASHREALNVLLVALRSGEGFLKLTGEVGTGKTLLCRKLLAAIEHEAETAYVPNPFLNPNALRLAVAEELGLRFPRNLGQHRLLKQLTARLIAVHRGGRRAVLVIDEAQALPDDSLEAVRLLTNLETEKTKLLQVVLLGQPELDARLAQPRLRQLRQRIAFSHRLRPMDEAECGAYLTHRLVIAGRQGPSPFEPGAVRLLHRASRGIPRLVNILAHKALLVAFGRGDRSVAAAHVRRAIRDTEDAHLPRPWWRRLLGAGRGASDGAGREARTGGW